MREKKIIQPFIKHDENASQDGKILKLYLAYRKKSKMMTKEELESFISHGVYGIFWRILEFLYSNHLYTNEIEILSDNLRIDTEILKDILDNYELFDIENNEYISRRLLADKKRKEEKAQTAAETANTRWLISAFNKYYRDEFGETPVLDSTEIEKLKNYNKKIPDLREKLRDILYTLYCLNFDTNINFKPCANWLLTKNNLARLMNGEFGKLKHKPTEKEIREEQKKLQKEAQEQNALSEIKIAAMEIKTKNSAIDFIKKHSKKTKLGILINPECNELMDKFGITKKNIEEA